MLAEITEIFPAVSQTMLRFYRQRLLPNLMVTSPLFKRLNAEERRALVEKFKSRGAATREALGGGNARRGPVHAAHGGR